MVKELTKENFQEITKKGVILIDFWAPWCGPCKMLAPIIEEISEEVKGAVFCKVNVDNNKELASEYKVMSIPSVFILKNGEVVDKFVGNIPKQAILDKVNNQL